MLVKSWEKPQVVKRDKFEGLQKKIQYKYEKCYNGRTPIIPRISFWVWKILSGKEKNQKKEKRKKEQAQK